MLKNLLTPLLILLFQNLSIGQCFIPDYTHIYCPDDFVLDLTLAETNGNGTYTYFENGVEIINPFGYFPIGSTVVNGTFTENTTGCVAEFQVIIEAVIFPEPDLQEEYILNCNTANITIDLDLPDDILFDFYWTDPTGTLFAVDQIVELDAPGKYELEIFHLVYLCSIYTDFDVILDDEIPVSGAEITLNCDSTAFIELTPSFNTANWVIEWTGPGLADISNPFNILVEEIGSYQYTIVNSINGCSYQSSITVDSLNCLDTNVEVLNWENEIEIFPNPAGNILNIEIGNFDYGNYEFQIFNSIGQLSFSLINLEPNKDVITIDINDWPRGNYYILLNNERKLLTKKFQKF